VSVYALGDLEPTIDPTAYIHPDATVIGDVTLGPGTTVWPQAVLRGDYGIIRVGARTSVQDGAVLHTTPITPTVVGDDVVIVHRAAVVGDDVVIGHLAHLECCTVHDGALIGTGSIVLHRAVIEVGALVGAGAVVPNGMVVPARAMALGVPAKIRPDSVDVDDTLRNAAEYVRNGERYRRDLRRID
jgi:carbonic anhydrase/acetyltransferase-like protein (isoleucine patch superfamily)